MWFVHFNVQYVHNNLICNFLSLFNKKGRREIRVLVVLCCFATPHDKVQSPLVRGHLGTTPENYALSVRARVLSFQVTNRLLGWSLLGRGKGGGGGEGGGVGVMLMLDDLY